MNNINKTRSIDENARRFTTIVTIQTTLKTLIKLFDETDDLEQQDQPRSRSLQQYRRFDRGG